MGYSRHREKTMTLKMERYQELLKVEAQLANFIETLADYTDLAKNVIADLEKVEAQLAECQQQRDLGTKLLGELERQRNAAVEALEKAPLPPGSFTKRHVIGTWLKDYEDWYREAALALCESEKGSDGLGKGR